MSPKKGPFWVVNATDLLVAYPVDLDVEPVSSHKVAWDICNGNIKKNWNYYPRGRVEIRHGKALVFLNGRCFERHGLEDELRRVFNLGLMEVKFKIDHSAHYTKGVFED